jgi:cytidine deaminase
VPPAEAAPLPPVLRAQLLALARAAARRAYCPYSRFHVGAAVLAGGRITTGCNVENASYGLTICAERNAIFAAVAGGASRIDAVAVCCADAPPDAPDSLRVPCGACRQVLAEFGGPDLPVLIDGVGVVPLRDLLPNAFVLREPAAPAADPDAPRPGLGIDLDAVFGPAGPVPGAREALHALAGAFALHLVAACPPPDHPAALIGLAGQDLPEHSLHLFEPGSMPALPAGLRAAVAADRDRADALARAGLHAFLLAPPAAAPEADSLVHRVATWSELAEGLRALVAAR